MCARKTPGLVDVDVSKRSLDVHVLSSNERWKSANTPVGTDELSTRIAALSPTLDVLEATSKYEAPCAAALLRWPLRACRPPSSTSVRRATSS